MSAAAEEILRKEQKPQMEAEEARAKALEFFGLQVTKVRTQHNAKQRTCNTKIQSALPKTKPYIIYHV
jgi:hypothetical protein